MELHAWDEIAWTVTEDGMRLLALVESPDHVCCRYRIRAFESALCDIGCTLVCQGLERGLLPRLRQLRSAAEYDAVLLQRKLLPSWQLAILRRASRHLAFDFDDAVLFRDSYNRRGTSSTRRAGRFARMVRTADVVIAGNDFLAACASRSGAEAERVRVIPTCVDPTRYSAKAFDREDGTNRPPDLVWIGSSSTLKGIEAERPLLERLGREFPGLRLRVICDRFPQFENVEVVPVIWSEATEAEELATGDVGIGLIPDDDWSRGKCGLKILQYQAAGLPVIANPVGSHAEMIAPGATGWLATTPDEWSSAVRALSEASVRARMGREARRRLESDYSVAAWGATFANAAAGLARQPVDPWEERRGSAVKELHADAGGDVTPNYNRRMKRISGTQPPEPLRVLRPGRQELD